MSKIILACDNLKHDYLDGQCAVNVLKGVNLKVKESERVAVVGESGSGKSTLLHCLGGLEKPTSGWVKLMDQDLNQINDNERNRLRNTSLGFVYQFHHLLPELTAQENVAMPLLIAGDSAKTAKQQANYWLGQINMQDRIEHRPAQLSGGERQRVAIARALANNPKCVLADEPTGNLDHNNSEHIYELMLALTKELNTAFVIVTHDAELAKQMDRTLNLENGRLV